MYTHINTHMYIYAYMHTAFDTGKHLHLNPGSRITNYVTSGNFRLLHACFPVRGEGWPHCPGPCEDGLG